MRLTSHTVKQESL